MCKIAPSFLLAFLMLNLFAACQQDVPKVLPVLGIPKTVDGKTEYPKVVDFDFVDQDSQHVTNATFQDKIYVVDFFFTHCPTICPKVKAQAKRIYDKYLDDPRVLLLSHTIDIKNDTVPALKAYAHKLGIRTDKWHLVTGNRDSIYGIADDYFSVAQEDTTAAGGFDHSGRLILVDKNRHVRSFCDGTDPEDVDRFMHDIDVLLQEQFPEKQ